MNRVLTALRWEAVLQARARFYALTAVVALVWIGLLRLFPASWREVPEVISPTFVFANLQVTAFYFVAALVLLEKSEGALRALVVSPLRPGEYLAAKVLSLTMLGLAENAVICHVTFGPPPSWGWWMAGTAACAAAMALVGLVAIARYDAINTFIMPSALYIVLLTLPVVGYYDVVPMAAMAWHPLTPSFVLMRAAWAPVGAGWLIYGAVGSIAALAGLAVWARRRFVHLIAPAQA